MKKSYKICVLCENFVAASLKSSIYEHRANELFAANLPEAPAEVRAVLESVVPGTSAAGYFAPYPSDRPVIHNLSVQQSIDDTVLCAPAPIVDQLVSTLSSH